MSFTPRKVWMLIEAMTYDEGGHEAVDQESSTPIGATFEQHVAEVLFANLKERKSENTILFSGINPLPVAILTTLEEPEIPNSLMDLLENDR